MLNHVCVQSEHVHVYRFKMFAHTFKYWLFWCYGYFISTKFTFSSRCSPCLNWRWSLTYARSMMSFASRTRCMSGWYILATSILKWVGMILTRSIKYFILTLNFLLAIKVRLRLWKATAGGGGGGGELIFDLTSDRSKCRHDSLNMVETAVIQSVNVIEFHFESWFILFLKYFTGFSSRIYSLNLAVLDVCYH